MSDSRFELFQRLERTLASLDATFRALRGVPSSGDAADQQPAAVPEPSPSPVRDDLAAPVLTPDEEERIVRQLRALREEVRALGETLQNPPLDPDAGTDPAPDS